MKLFPIRSDRASLAVTETGGHLSGVTFALGNRTVSPLHTAPWSNESLPDDIPPILRILRGDFFCAPFGANDVISDGEPVHGPAANGKWQLRHSSDATLDAELEETILGARLTKHIELRSNHAVVYQRHTFTGGQGRLPVGHHAMLRADPVLRLGFGPWVWAATPPAEIETPPSGRSILAYPQMIADPGAALGSDGSQFDLTTYPLATDHEDLWSLVSDARQPFAWSAATCGDGGWVWFALKNPRLLPSTILWLSNGGRTYPPFSSRHIGVIGIEEVCSYFHLGHAASIVDNPIARVGVPTAIELKPAGAVTIPYLFGLAPVDQRFDQVTDIRAVDDGVVLVDRRGLEAFAACDVNFITGD
jgi:hypothetical protein